MLGMRLLYKAEKRFFASAKHESASSQPLVVGKKVFEGVFCSALGFLNTKIFIWRIYILPSGNQSPL